MTSEPTTALHEYAAQLRAMADELEQEQEQASPGRHSVYAAWAKHLREDAKSLQLLGEAARPYFEP